MCEAPLACGPELRCEAGTIYYFSADGDDANPGTMELPKRTIDEVNQLVLVPGARVLFRRGDTFAGSIAAKGGTVQAPIIYGAWTDANRPSVNRPIISGSRSIGGTGWTRLSGPLPIYYRSGIVIDHAAPVLILNGEVLRTARYPNDDYADAENVRGGNEGTQSEYATAIQDMQLPFSAQQVVGARLTHYDPWAADSTNVAGYSADGYLQFSELLRTQFYAYRSYYLSNRLAFVDQPGEWAYHRDTGTLYVWKPDGTAVAEGDVVEVADVEFGVLGYWVNDFVIRDLEFRYQRDASVMLKVTDRVRVEGNRFYAAGHGVRAWGSLAMSVWLDNVDVVDNVFDNILIAGVSIERGINRFCTIARNQFREIGTISHGGYGRGIAIQLYGTDSRIENNRIERTGFLGISPSGHGLNVVRNVVDRPCLNHSDCGGIYSSWSAEDGPSVIERNVIRDSQGYRRRYLESHARGIYNDFNNDDTIANNVVVGSQIGVGLTNSRRVRVTGNIVYGSDAWAIRMNKKGAPDGTGLANTIENNVLFALVPPVPTSWDLPPALVHWDNWVNDVDDDSRFDYNRYWNPYVEFPMVRYRPIGLQGPGAPWFQERWFDFSNWRAIGQDEHSQQERVFLGSPYLVNGVVGTSRVRNGGFGSGLLGWTAGGNVQATVESAQGLANAVRLVYRGIYLFGHFRQDASNAVGPLVAGAIYRMSFRVLGTGPSVGKIFNARVIQGGRDLASRPFAASVTPQRHEIFFVAASSAAAEVRFDFYGVSNTDHVYWLDDVELVQVNAAWDDPQARFPLLVNDTGQPLSFNLDANASYVDLDGAPVTSPLQVAPFSAVILVKQ